MFQKRADAQKQLEARARKVIVSAPAKEPDATVVLGVNFEVYDPELYDIVSMASSRRTAWRRSRRCCTTRSESATAR